jgi:catechol 2,3-dioxygenase-like lactoylglutathione lyase family enzyme
MFRVEGIDHVAIAVRDVERAAAWYQEVLGLERRHQQVWGDYPAMIGAGNTMIALFPIKGSSAKPTPGPDTVAMRHFAFRVDRKNFIAAQEELRRRKISFEFQDHTVSHSIYFFDPDGHVLELTTYEL